MTGRRVPRPSTRATPGLRYLRTSRALTQAELAERAGLRRSTIARLEGGQEARMHTLSRLAKALGVEPAELLRPPPEQRP
jgi:transcriptional regulator with XRE-family HTH domain